MARARLLAAAAVLSAGTSALVGCPGTLTLEEKQHLAYDCPDVPTVILARRCGNAGCHDAETSAGALDLASPKVEQRLIGAQSAYGEGALIDLRDPERSLLLTKLGDAPPFGARMPSGRPPIDPAAYACVRAWVYSFVPVEEPADAASTPDAPDAPDAESSADAPDDGGAQDAAAGEVSSDDAEAG